MAFSPVAMGSRTGWRSITPGRKTLQRDELVGRDRALVVDRLAQRIHDAADHGFANGHAHDASGALDLVAFFDLGVLAEQHHADLVFFQVHGDAGNVVRKLEQFSGHDFVEAVNAGDTVAQGDDRADFVHGNLGLVILDLLADQLRDLVCFDLCHKSALSFFLASSFFFSLRPLRNSFAIFAVKSLNRSDSQSMRSGF